MKKENVKSLENLSLFCHFCGLANIFLGILTILLEVTKRGIAYIQAGLFIFAMGYALVKISEKINDIVRDEESNVSSRF